MYPTLVLLETAFASSGAPAANDTDPSENRFDYRTELTASGIIAIEGHRLEDGRQFALKFEHSGRVTGKVAGATVRFWSSAAAHRRLRSRLAA